MNRRSIFAGGTKILLVQFVRPVLLSLPLLLLPLAQTQEKTAAAPAFDGGRLQAGQFTYRMVVGGRKVGTGRIAIRKAGGTGDYDFSGTFDFEADFAGYKSQRWNAVASSQMKPVSATLAFSNGPDFEPEFEIKYLADRANGFAIGHGATDKGRRLPVDSVMPADTVDQRIDWAAVMSCPLQEGRTSQFSVFDPGTGISQVVVTVEGSEWIEVPAGHFEVYRVRYVIRKNGADEKYLLFATKTCPRLMVREQFPNGEIDDLVQFHE